MRRLGFVLASALLLSGLSAPGYAASGGHHLPHFGGRTFLNYGPHKPDVVVNARTSTAFGNVNVGDDTLHDCRSTYWDSPTLLPTQLCVWYAPSGTNAPGAGYVQQVLDALQRTETTYLNAGYLPVEQSADPIPGYNGQMNLYLHNLDHATPTGSLYGFTSADSDRGLYSNRGRDRAAYMVIDNNFAASKFPDADGFPGCSSTCSTAIMQVTVAHEFFHATQYAYDAFTADTWFMESTATWAETQVYPSLHDNWLYFDVPEGVLTTPGSPLDDNTGSTHGLAYYQDFAWIQYLGQVFPTKLGAMPVIVRNVWNYMDSRKGRPAYFSISAINHAIDVASSHAASLPSTWLAFSAGNRHHVLGAQYPISKAAWSRTVSPSNLSQAKVGGSVNHLSSQTFVLTPKSLSSTERIHLAVRVGTQSGTVAGVTMYYRSGAIRTYPMTFSGGYAMRNFGFDSSSLLKVELTIGAASTRYNDCWGQTDWACGGTPAIAKVGFTWTGSFFHL